MKGILIILALIGANEKLKEPTNIADDFLRIVCCICLVLTLLI